MRHSYCQFCGWDPDDPHGPDGPCEGCTEDLPFGLTIPIPPFDQHRIDVDIESFIPTCDRCGMAAAITSVKYTDDFGEEHEMAICHDCDWDIMNGDRIRADPYEVHMDHLERDYLEDPINNDPPPGYYGCY